MNERTARRLWLGWGLLGLVVEVWALTDEEHHDTLSALIWRVRRSSTLGRFVVVAAFAWLVWHFLVQPALPDPVEEALRSTPVDDLAIVAIAILSGIPDRNDEEDI